MANFDGLAQDEAAAGPGEPPDVSAAAGPSHVVEAVNRRVAAFTRAGDLRCTLTLAAFFGAADPSGPRVQYDRVYNRYSLVAAAPRTGAEASTGLYLAASRSGDPCEDWWIYRLTFAGTLLPRGAWFDRPYLGQDPQALLLSSDGFRGASGASSASYAGSVAFALPKAAVYAGTPTDVPTFPVGFSTAPVTTAVPGEDSFYLQAVSGRGYQLYRMVNSVGPGTLLLDEATVTAPFAVPARRIRQCTGATLDPLDGRITAPPVRVGDYVWFAHGVDAAGRPGVRYGAIGLFDHSVTVAAAAHSATSDDFNPSIGVSDAGYGLAYAWLNWAYTDTAAHPCTNVSVVVDGVAPGAGLPDLLGTGIVLVHGGASSADASFGQYSSVVVDPQATPDCPGGRTAVTAQQYFDAGGQWHTRIARLAFC
jgi:hypothetical protein